MLITSDMKMAELIHLDFHLLAVVQRIGIPLGFKEKTIDEVCKENDVDTAFFLQLANCFHDNENLSKVKFPDFNLRWFVSFLRRTHQCYLEHKIPEIQVKINELISEIKESVKNYELIRNFFTEYINELSEHIGIEEKTVFPYIITLSDCIEQEVKTDAYLKNYQNYNINVYLGEHDDIEEKIYDLKNILIKYLAPPTDSCKYNSLLYELFRLEKDIQIHSILEEKILIPKVRQIEKQIANF